MSGDRLGIGVIGCGMMAQSVHLPNIARHPDLALRWCCDPNPAALEQARKAFHPAHATADARQVAADENCHLALIAASHGARRGLVELFARAGKHIYLEKPMAESFEELRHLLGVVSQTGALLTVGHNRRMAPAVIEAQRMLEKHRARPVSPQWRYNRDGVGPADLPGEGRVPGLVGGAALVFDEHFVETHEQRRSQVVVRGVRVNVRRATVAHDREGSGIQVLHRPRLRSNQALLSAGCR